MPNHNPYTIDNLIGRSRFLLLGNFMGVDCFIPSCVCVRVPIHQEHGRCTDNVSMFKGYYLLLCNTNICNVYIGKIWHTIVHQCYVDVRLRHLHQAFLNWNHGDSHVYSKEGQFQNVHGCSIFKNVWGLQKLH